MSKLFKDNFLRIKSDKRPERGSLLISEPFSNGEVFERSVILLVEYNDEGVVGFILNKPVELDDSMVEMNIDMVKNRFFLGGPVETEYLYCIHPYGSIIDSSEEFLPGLYWGGELEQINDFVEDKIVNPEKIILFLGYAGWTKEQLNKEIDERHWVVVENTIEDLFQQEPDLWNQLVQGLGDEFRTWKDLPDHPAMN